MEETGHFCEVLTFRVSKVSFFNYDFKPVLCLNEFLKIDVSSCTAFEGKRKVPDEFTHQRLFYRLSELDVEVSGRLRQVPYVEERPEGLIPPSYQERDSEGVGVPLKAFTIFGLPGKGSVLVSFHFDESRDRTPVVIEYRNQVRNLVKGSRLRRKLTL